MLAGSYTSAGVGGVNEEINTGLASIAAVTATTIGDINTALSSFEKNVDTALANVGNSVQRLDVKENFLTNAIANSKASVSRLFDADMVMEQLNATKGQIGGQVATAMFSQLNLSPQNILQLFG